MKIVIVDDNKRFCDTLRYFITENLGYEVTDIYNDPFEFLEKVKTSITDIILMDIRMPKLNGIDTTKKVLIKNVKLKVIAVSNLFNSLSQRDIIEAGIKGYVNKDKVFEELNKAILKVYNGKLYFPEMNI